LARRINVLVDIGFTTGEIRTFLDRIDDQPSERLAQINDLQGRRVAKIDAVISKLTATRAELVGLLVTDEALDVQDQAAAVRRQ
jgi:DNA-binding transcriptional MerR regulator